MDFTSLTFFTVSDSEQGKRLNNECVFGNDVEFCQGPKRKKI